MDLTGCNHCVSTLRYARVYSMTLTPTGNEAKKRWPAKFVEQIDQLVTKLTTGGTPYAIHRKEKSNHRHHQQHQRLIIITIEQECVLPAWLLQLCQLLALLCIRLLDTKGFGSIFRGFGDRKRRRSSRIEGHRQIVQVTLENVNLALDQLTEQDTSPSIFTDADL
jgi:hypothetical protein